MLTATIPHPTFTTPSGSFGVVVRKFSRTDSIKRAAELEAQEIPHLVTDPETGKPAVDKAGRAIYAWRRPSPTWMYVYDNISSFVVGLVNPPNDDEGRPLQFVAKPSNQTEKDSNAASLWALLDSKYDLVDKDGDTISFAVHILAEWSNGKLFPDPTAAPSATS